LDQVPEQGQMQRLGGRCGRSGHPLEDRRQPVGQRRQQREQNRYHRGILAAVTTSLVAGTPTEADAGPRPRSPAMVTALKLAKRIKVLSRFLGSQFERPLFPAYFTYASIGYRPGEVK